MGDEHRPGLGEVCDIPAQVQDIVANPKTHNQKSRCTLYKPISRRNSRVAESALSSQYKPPNQRDVVVPFYLASAGGAMATGKSNAFSAWKAPDNHVEKTPDAHTKKEHKNY